MLLVAGFISAALWLSIGFDRKKYDIYTVYLSEPVSGLSDESAVKYNGVKVGLVNRIELNQIDPQQVKIQLLIEEGTPITTSTEATLVAQGITGTTYLGLTASSPSMFPLQKTPGEPYPVIPYKPSFLFQLEKNINEISKGFKRILSKANANAIKHSLANIEEISDTIAKDRQKIDQTLRDFPVILNNLKVSISKFNILATDLSAASKQISSAMQAGKNSIDKISQQALPPAVQLLDRLDTMTANLEKVSAEMRQNPAVVIRGSAPPKPGPGE